jgi:branched-chain amino acid transport system permease protein
MRTQAAVAADSMSAHSSNAASTAWTRMIAAIIGQRAKSRRRSTLLALLLLAALASVPIWSSSSFNVGRFSVAVTYVMAAIGLSLAAGFAGELVLGHAAIMAVSAYVAGMLSAKLSWDFAAAVFAAMAVGVAFGLLMMSPGLRVRGWYFSLMTLFAVLVTPRVANLLDPWTGGEYGLTGIRTASLFGLRLTSVAMFECSVVCLGVIWFATANFLQSGWGLRLQALRDIPRAAQASGINLVTTRLTVYVLASLPAALAGALLAYIEQFVNAESFGMGLTLLLLTGVMLGGSGTLWGPIVGMAPLIGLSFWVGPFSEYNAIALGVGLLGGSLIFPDGIVAVLAQVKEQSSKPTYVEHGESTEILNAAAVAAANSSPPAVRTSLHLRVSNVTKHFGGLRALVGVDLELHRGTLVGLVGPNGSGKSTFLNMLSGFVMPDSGSIELNGNKIANWPVHRIAKAGVGRTFQIPQLIDELSAIENIRLSLVGRSIDSVVAAALRTPSVIKREKQQVDKAVSAFIDAGLPLSNIALPVAELPLGLKRIVEVARAIAPMPEILLLDEPAAGLNAEERKTLGMLLRALRERGMTILLVEHNVPFVTEYCDELVLLEAGRVTARAALDAPLPHRLDAYLKYKPGTEPEQLGAT